MSLFSKLQRRCRVLRVGSDTFRIAKYRVVPPPDGFEVKRNILRRLAAKFTTHGVGRTRGRESGSNECR